MICRIFESEHGSDIHILDRVQCIFQDCEFHKDHKCTISQDVNVHLDSHKYGWKISKKINLQELYLVKTSAGSYYIDKIIKLMHPDRDDVWIFNCFKKDKETQVYLVYISAKYKGTFKNIVDVMSKLKKEVQYNTRIITEKDFLKEE